MKAAHFLRCGLLLLGSLARAEDLAIIAAKTVPIDNITSTELSLFFLCKKNEGPDGSKVVIVTREKGSAERIAALANIYKLSDIAYERYFMQQVFTGALAAAPKLASSGAAMKKIVTVAPGTLGYVRATDVDASVKVVKVDGLAPGEPNYPLKLAN